MPVRQRGNSWQVDVRKQGHVFRHNYPKKEHADNMLAKVMYAIDTNKPLPNPLDFKTDRDMTVADLLYKTADKFWNDSNWGRRQRIVADNLIAILGNSKPISELNEDAVEQVVDALRDQGAGAATINRRLSCLSKAMTYAHRRGWLDRKPIIEWHKESTGRLRYVTEEEELVMFKMLTEWGLQDAKDFFTVMIDTGLRISEVNNINIRDVNGDNLTVWETKNGLPRTVPMTKRVKEVIHRRKGDIKVTRYILRTAWDRLREHMGLEHDKEFVMYCLRHTCASRLVQRGVHLLVVKEWLGHCDIKMTMRYSHLCPSNLMDAVKVLENDSVTESVTNV